MIDIKIPAYVFSCRYEVAPQTRLIDESRVDEAVLILPKGITKTAKNEVNSQRGGLLPILLGGLASSLIGNFLSKELFGGSGIKRAGEGI